MYEHQIAYDHRRAQRSVYAPALLEKMRMQRAQSHKAELSANLKVQQRAAVAAHAEKRAKLLRAEQTVRERVAAERELTLNADIMGVSKSSKLIYLTIELRACKAFNLSPIDLRSKSRVMQLALARQFVAYWMCRLTTLSLPQIGRLMDRDHTTALHSMLKYPEKRKAMGRHLPPARDSKATR